MGGPGPSETQEDVRELRSVLPWDSGSLPASKLLTLVIWVTEKELVHFAMEKLKEIERELEELRPGYYPMPTR